jgi:hypothetical protein
MNMPLSSDAEFIVRLKILIEAVSKEHLKEIKIDQMTSISTLVSAVRGIAKYTVPRIKRQWVSDTQDSKMDPNKHIYYYLL